MKMFVPSYEQGEGSHGKGTKTNRGGVTWKRNKDEQGEGRG